MPRLEIDNLRCDPVMLDIQPWATAVLLGPDEQMIVQYQEPLTLEFQFDEDNATLAIDSEYVMVRARGRDSLLASAHEAWATPVDAQETARRDAARNRPPSVIVHNHGARTVSLGIEPWADLELLGPDEQMTVEYRDPADLAFGFDEVGGSLWIGSEYILVKANGCERLLTPRSVAATGRVC